MLHHERRAPGIVDAHAAAACRRAVDQHDGIVPPHQLDKHVFRQTRAAEHDTVDRALLEGAEQVGLAVRVFDGIAQQQAVSCCLSRVIGAATDVGKEWVGDIGNNQADRACVVCRQAAGNAARTIVEPVDDFLDTLERGTADFALVVERA